MVGLAIAGATVRQRRRAAIVALALVASTAIAVPYATVALPPVGPFLPIFATLAAGGDALTAFLVFSQARVGKSWSLFALALGYSYSAVVIVPHILVFPDVFSSSGLLGASPQSATWFWVWWHAGFPLFVLAYVAIERTPWRAHGARIGFRPIAAALVALVALVCALLVLTNRESTLLPQLIQKDRYDLLIASGVGPIVIALIASASIALVAITKLRNITQLWLGVALLASLCDCSLTLVAGGRYTGGWYVARIESLVASAAVLLAYLGAIATMLEQFARQSHIDGLTGLANRRSFDDAFETQTTIAGRSKAPLSVLMLDVDWFKKFNDAYGHPRGDDALRAVAQAIAASLPRRTDIAARYGGEEFVVILPGTATAGAHAVAERIRETVERLAISHSGSTYGRLSVSIGVATLVAEDRAGAPAALLARADAALYLAKAGGRNAVVPPLSLRREPIAGR